MILERTNICSKKSNFLDLNICVNENQFVTNLYDKRNDFDFKVISMPNLKSNVPERRSYDVFYSQLFRLCNVNTTLDGFIQDVKALKVKLLCQNFRADILNKYIKLLKSLLMLNHHVPTSFGKFLILVVLSRFLKNQLIL